MSVPHTIDPLQATLLDLLYALREADFPLILGGGYGLFLKQRHVSASNERLLLSAIPPLRSTNDLDLFLRTELFVDSSHLKKLRDAFDSLDFIVIPSAPNYQFARKFVLGERMWNVKVDLLARQPDPAQYPQVKFDARRVKPNSAVGIHAHTTPEAVAVEEETTPVIVSGHCSDGREYSGTVFIPSTYAFLMMKLFALNDQCQEERKEYGRKHALDIYGLIALLTKSEYDMSLLLREQYRKTKEATLAGEIIVRLFNSATAQGCLRLREHPDCPKINAAGMNDFLSTLAELFPVSQSAEGL